MRRALSLFMLLAVAACGAGQEVATTTTDAPESSTTVDGVTTTSGESSPVHPGLASRVEIAVADLANRLGVSEAEIEVVSAQPVTWPDASLGCPQPDMQYAQVVTDGALIELRSGGVDYSYHMGGSTYEPFLCESPVKAEGAGPATTIDPTLPTIERGDLTPSSDDRMVPPPGYDD